ncbi:MAG: hypothetical protein NTX22_13055 [Ignavibacteriales bacterium]|nr:hypothetical protein [Ignavibacteriales bacterium]
MGNEKTKSGWNLSAKQWVPVAGLIILTIALIFFFKNKNISQIVDEQKHNLVEFYSQNLKPLFVGTSITNDDVFNFAMNNELPLDKNNKQYLKLGDESEGNKYFEFVKNSDGERKNNLNQFVKSFEFNNVQKQKLDSLLESYQDEIRKQVLINDKNTIAINSNLWNLNKAIRADIFMFASQANSAKFNQLVPLYHNFYNNPGLNKFVSEARDARDSNYFFVTPDSIFSSVYKMDEENIKREIADKKNALKDMKDDFKVRIAFQKEMMKLQNEKNKQNFTMQIDPNFCRIQVPNVEIPEIKIPDLPLAIADLNEVTNELKKLNFKMHTKNMRITEPESSTEVNPPEVPQDFELNIDLPDLNEIVQQSMSIGLEALKNVNIPAEVIDSIVNSIHAEVGDSSSKYFDKKAFKKQMEQLKKELKQAKKQNKVN